jgi:hypothetical protein
MYSTCVDGLCSTVNIDASDSSRNLGISMDQINENLAWYYVVRFQAKSALVMSEKIFT